MKTAVRLFCLIPLSAIVFLSAAVAQESSADREFNELLKKADLNRDNLIADHEHAVYIRARFETLDRNKDGKITRREMMFNQGLLDRNTMEPLDLTTDVARQKMKEIDTFFLRNDVNGDGIVTLYENMTSSRATFKKVDTNADSFISRKEYSDFEAKNQ